MLLVNVGLYSEDPPKNSYLTSFVITVLHYTICIYDFILFNDMMQIRNLRIGAMMRTILPALAHAIVMNYEGGAAEKIKEGIQVCLV